MPAIPRSLRRISVVAVALAAAGSLPAVQARAKAVAVMAEGLGFSIPRPFAAGVTRREVALRGVVGDIYGGDEPWPALVLVPGAAPEGKDDVRVVRLARAFARAERTVFVPQLALGDRRFVTDDVEALVTAVLALDHDHPGPVTLFGFSYGGSFALLAAADERLDGSLGQVATFGAYYDLIGVAQAVTSEASVVDGRTIPWDAHPSAVEVFQKIVIEMSPAPARAGLSDALESRVEPDVLSPEARAVFEFVTNDDPERTFALAARLPEDMRALLRTFSPSSVAAGIDVPVLALHSTDDPVVPYGEALRLHGGIPGSCLETVALFRHVNLGGGSSLARARDMLATWRFASRILGAQE